MPAQWTLLVYMAADNHLSQGNPSQVDVALGQMMAAESNPAVNVIAEVVSTGAVMQRYQITQGQKAALGPSVTQVNTGLPGPLTDFINFGTQNYPATNVALVIWTDGDGVIDWGAESDATMIPKSLTGGACACGFSNTFKSYLTTALLANALAASNYGQQGQKLGIVAFDACLMSMAEIGYQIRTSASFMVASELEVMNGLPYTAILNGLVASPGVVAATLATNIVIAFGQDNTQNDNETLAAIDLVKITGFVSAFQSLVGASGSNLPVFASARKINDIYGGSFVDLTAFFSRLSAQPDVSQVLIGNAIGALQASFVTPSVIVGPGVVGYGGVSFYYPNLAEVAKIASPVHAAALASNLGTYQALAFPTDTGWGALLGQLLAAASSPQKLPLTPPVAPTTAFSDP